MKIELSNEFIEDLVRKIIGMPDDKHNWKEVADELTRQLAVMGEQIDELRKLSRSHGRKKTAKKSANPAHILNEAKIRFICEI